MDPAVSAGENAEADAAEALREPETRRVCKDEVGGFHSEDTLDRRTGTLLPLMVYDLRTKSMSTSGILILTGQTS